MREPIQLKGCEKCSASIDKVNISHEYLTIDAKRCEYLERLCTVCGHNWSEQTISDRENACTKFVDEAYKPRTELEREVNESLLENCKQTQENIRRQREGARGQSAFFNAKGSLQEEQRAQQQRHCTATQYTETQYTETQYILLYIAEFTIFTACIYAVFFYLAK